MSPSARSLDDTVTEHLPVVGHLVSELGMRLPLHVSRDDLAGAGVVADALRRRRGIARP